MLLSELRPEIEKGKTARLSIEAATYGVSLTILISKTGEGFIWHRPAIADAQSGRTIPEVRKSFPTWDDLSAYTGGMQARDTTWEIVEDEQSQTSIDSEPQLLEEKR